MADPDTAVPRLPGFPLDRRRLLVAGAATLMGMGCSRKGDGKAMASAGPAAHAPPDGMWLAFRRLYLAREGRIVDNGNGGISHSEGQGYGLLLATLVGDRPAFEALLGWTEANLARSDVALFAWRYDPRAANPVADANNATDGDILIAWALARAARQWGNPAWAGRSGEIRGAIRDRLVVERFGQSLLLPGLVGFDAGASVTLNPSYYIWPALDAFAAFDGPDRWQPVIESGEALVRAARFGPNQLPTDWIVVGADGMPQPAPGKPPQFGFDAIRVPLYALAGRRAGLVQPIADFWRARGAGGRPLPAWVDVVTGAEAPFALSPGGQDVARRLLGQPLAREALAPDYYGCMLQLLAHHLG